MHSCFIKFIDLPRTSYMCKNSQTTWQNREALKCCPQNTVQIKFCIGGIVLFQMKSKKAMFFTFNENWKSLSMSVWLILFWSKKENVALFCHKKGAYWEALSIKMISTVTKETRFTGKIDRGFRWTGCGLLHPNGTSQRKTRLGKHPGDVQGIITPWTWHLRLNDWCCAKEPGFTGEVDRGFHIDRLQRSK